MTLRSATNPPARRVIGVVAAKGGLGASTVALDWARALGQENARCLLLEIAGGDIAWMAGGSPHAFTENVATGAARPQDAVVAIEPHVDLLATGNAWAVHGAPSVFDIERLVINLTAGSWKRWVIDIGNTRPEFASPIWKVCTTIAVVLDDDIASVSRTYALTRRLSDLGWGDRIALVFNRLADGAQAEALRERFAQVTRQFLGRTWPLCGVVPDGPPERRRLTIAAWASDTQQSKSSESIHNHRINGPAVTADNIG